MSRWTVVFFGERRILPTVYLVCQLKGRGRSSLFECELPFDHKTLHLELEDKNFAGVMEGHQNEFKTTKSQEELVEESLANPYGSPSLEELCAGKKDIVIISSDHTRPVPSRVTMPILLHHIHSAAPEARVRILVATGMHRPSTHEELVNKYGEEIVANEEIVMHVATDDSMMKKIGTLPSGGECIINKIAADCDLLLAEGFIEPHFFAGFSGSRKSVLPGIASYKTIMYNHNGQFVNDSHSRAGNLCHNHVSEDMFAAAEMAHLAFVLNVVLNGKHEVIGSFAGDIHKAHEAGCEFVKSLAGVEPVECEIAITTNGGYPLDHNIADNDPAEFERACIDRPKDETLPDQWTSQIFARILAHHPVIMVTDLCDHQMIKDMHMTPVNTLDEALKLAFEMKGADAKVAVIPDGLGVVVAQH